jgi:hypothetical protein
MGRHYVLFLLLLSFVGVVGEERVVLLGRQQAEIADLSREFDLVEELVEKQVSMRGKLVLKILPGAPEYSSIEEGDAAIACWLLRLESSKEEIALCLSDDLRDFCNKHIGKQISVEGVLFPAHTTHHPTRVLIDVQRMEWDSAELTESK